MCVFERVCDCVHIMCLCVCVSCISLPAFLIFCMLISFLFFQAFSCHLKPQKSRNKFDYIFLNILMNHTILIKPLNSTNCGNKKLAASWLRRSQRSEQHKRTWIKARLRVLRTLRLTQTLTPILTIIQALTHSQSLLIWFLHQFKYSTRTDRLLWICWGGSFKLVARFA